MKVDTEDYIEVKKAIRNILDKPSYDDGSLAPVVVRLAWHSSGTFDHNDKTGGSEGSTMRFHKEARAKSNLGLENARNALEIIKVQFPWMSYADLWTLAGATAIEHMGGPYIPWRPGRTDDLDDEFAIEPGRLPNGDDTASKIRRTFYRMGFNDQEIVALIGCHSVGRTHMRNSSFDGPWTPTPTKFSNAFFRQMFDMKWELQKSPVGRLQYYNSDKTVMMIPSDMVLFEDKKFKRYVKLYAKDEAKFFADFAAAFSKLLELGCSLTGNAIPPE